MATIPDRALALTRRGVARPDRRRMAQNALLVCGIGSSATYVVAANVAGALPGAATAR